MYLFILINLFFFSFQIEIIRDLPSNIYHIEDMSQFESKSIQEGTKYYIKLPKTKSPITFYLTIPKNIELFPLYSAEFINQPNDNEIINKDFTKEISFKNKEDFEYSIYKFDIENSDSYKVLYFKNNEILNYLSLYAHSLSSTELWIRDINFKGNSAINGVEANFPYYFRVRLEKFSKYKIETTTTKTSGRYAKLYVAGFSGFPLNDTIENYNSWKEITEEEISSDTYYDFRKYIFTLDNDPNYLVVKVQSDLSFPHFGITVSNGSTDLKWWEIFLIVIGAIIFIILCLWGALTETGRACCAVLLICCLIFKR